MKTIDTLIEDMDKTLLDGIDPEEHSELIEEYTQEFKKLLQTRFRKREVPERGFLRMSSIGQPCERKLYYEINSPKDAEPLDANTIFKFIFGDVIELLTLFVAEASGHKVEGTQGTLKINGITGHRDAVIDGVTVDAKSASPFSFEKFKAGKIKDDDPFGYVLQLQNYMHVGQDDPIVTDKKRGAFLVVNKVTGERCLDFHEFENLPLEDIFERKREVVNSKDIPPRRFDPVPDGKSGNMKLQMNCSYCSFKWKCHPGLRGFAYSRGPVFLTTVKRTPDVFEFTKT